jgi:site-specific DNA-methyltransferase (cytosine-N4-specific)
MLQLLKRGYRAKKRPSGHDISEKFSTDNGAAIPPNLIGIAHTESNGQYQRYCKKHGHKVHPARYPTDLPEFFVRMLTDERDTVIDPFAGSCATGEVCERLHRRWYCIELQDEYLDGALGRFQPGARQVARARRSLNYQIEAPELVTPAKRPEDSYYRLARPSLLWNGTPTDSLGADGGRRRTLSTKSTKEPTRRRGS